MAPDTSGVVIVDKPAGVTSAKALAEVKRLCGVKKAGHAGTLDPFATGVLVCCLNQATRLAEFFLHDWKKYRGTLHLGIETDTQDPTGRVMSEKSPVEISTADVNRVAGRFTGSLEQVPPVYSALKHKGTPLYRLAREGRPVQKPARKVTISKLTILDIDIPFVSFEVTCSAGTYIRTLCADIGRELGCGGHLKTLLRLESSGFSIDEAVSMAGLAEVAAADALDGKIITMADALRGVSAVTADRKLADRIRHGQQVTHSELEGGPGLAPLAVFKVLDEDGRLLAVMSKRGDGEQLDYRCVFSR